MLDEDACKQRVRIPNQITTILLLLAFKNLLVHLLPAQICEAVQQRESGAVGLAHSSQPDDENGTGLLQRTVYDRSDFSC